MTPLQREYLREYNNLKRRAKRLDKAQIDYKLPTFKKATRKEIDRIKNIRGERIFNIATQAVDIQTGEVVKGSNIKYAYRRNKKIIKEQSKKDLSNEVDNYLDNWIEELENINVKRKKGDYDGYHLLKAFYYTGIKTYGRREFGLSMIHAEESGNSFTWQVVAYLQLALEYINSIKALLPDKVDYDGEELTREEFIAKLEEVTDGIYE